jgi:hypothetical protein
LQGGYVAALFSFAAASLTLAYNAQHEFLSLILAGLWPHGFRSGANCFHEKSGFFASHGME